MDKSSEELYETLMDLKIESAIFRKNNEESEKLLKGFQILVDRYNEKEILDDIIFILRDIIGCEDIVLMTINNLNELTTTSATSGIFYDLKLLPQAFLKRIMKGDIAISFDIKSIPEWEIPLKRMGNRIKSSIHLGLPFSEKNSILICCDSKPHFFNNSQANSIKRYSTIVTQALISVSTQEKIELLNKKLLAMARQAGMSDVATSVLHNIGNVLNSLGVSSSVLHDKIENISSTKLLNLINLIEDNLNDQYRYFSEDPIGKKLFQYIFLIAKESDVDKKSLLEEVDQISLHVKHIKYVVSMQQSIAKPIKMTSTIIVSKLIKQIIKRYSNQIDAHKIIVTQNYESELAILTDQYKLEQIIQNVLQNAIESLIQNQSLYKKLIISTNSSNDQMLIKIADNGVGISADDINKIFNFGYTTREEGHGFGLHYSALAAKELDGELQVVSKGKLQGAEFILTLPLKKYNG